MLVWEQLSNFMILIYEHKRFHAYKLQMSFKYFVPNKDDNFSNVLNLKLSKYLRRRCDFLKIGKFKLKYMKKEKEFRLVVWTFTLSFSIPSN